MILNKKKAEKAIKTVPRPNTPHVGRDPKLHRRDAAVQVDETTVRPRGPAPVQAEGTVLEGLLDHAPLAVGLDPVSLGHVATLGRGGKGQKKAEGDESEGFHVFGSCSMLVS